MTIKINIKHFAKNNEKMDERAKSMVTEAITCLEEIKDAKCKGAEFTGWYDYPERNGKGLVKEVSSYVANLNVFYDAVIVIGIGGSYLGTRAITDALSHEYQALLSELPGASAKPMMFFAGQSVSEAGLVELLDVLDKKQPVVNVISKSGTTTEPGVAFRIIRNYMEARFGKEEASKRIIATTDQERGALRKLATEQNYKTFVVPDDVGGRFSVLTAVGLVPMALGGFNIEALMHGADKVFQSMRAGSLAENPVIKYAAYRTAAYAEGKHMEVLSIAEPKMRNFVEWWKQLFGESEGKEHKGLFPAGLTFTTDLHSLGQYMQDGERSMIETFLKFNNACSRDANNVERRLKVPATPENLDGLDYLKGRFVSEINDAAMEATRIAHTDGGVPCIELEVEALNEENLGALFAFFETACGISAAMIGVNPYDQPGVENYKKNLFGLLGKPGFEELGAKLKDEC